MSEEEDKARKLIEEARRKLEEAEEIRLQLLRVFKWRPT